MFQNFKAILHRGSDFFRHRKSLRAQRSSADFITSQLLSDSQNTRFELCVTNINKSPELFHKFRNIYDFRSIVETVSYKQGLAYLKRISELQENYEFCFDAYRRNEIIGSPITYRYQKFGKISPTTLRYVSVALEIRKLFGNNLSGNFVEIGAGYGGQVSIFSEFFEINEYGIYDLAAVQDLTKKYLTKLGKIDKISMHSISNVPTKNWDFAMSNYAFSELPSELQKQYIESVLSRAKKGYLIMNSGNSNNTGRSTGKLSLQELRNLLPAFEVFEENPVTGSDNYVIVWGHS